MGMTISNVGKSARGRPRVDATPVTVRIPPDQLATLDAWIAERPDPKPSRPEAIRRLLELTLVGPGRPYDRLIGLLEKPPHTRGQNEMEEILKETIELAAGFDELYYRHVLTIYANYLSRYAMGVVEPLPIPEPRR